VQCIGAPAPDARVPERGFAEREIGQFVENARFDRILLSLAQRNHGRGAY